MPVRLPSREQANGHMGPCNQNRNFAPSWKTRGGLVLVICPKLLAVTLVLGPPSCVWLKVLNVSARNSNLMSSFTWNPLYAAIFQLLRPGATTLFRAAVPHWSGPGFANDEVLNHWNWVPG